MFGMASFYSSLVMRSSALKNNCEIDAMGIEKLMDVLESCGIPKANVFELFSRANSLEISRDDHLTMHELSDSNVALLKVMLKNVMLSMVEKMRPSELREHLQPTGWTEFVQSTKSQKKALRHWIIHPECKIFLRPAHVMPIITHAYPNAAELLPLRNNPELEKLSMDELRAYLKKLRQSEEGDRASCISRIQVTQEYISLRWLTEEDIKRFLISTAYWTSNINGVHGMAIRRRMILWLRYPWTSFWLIQRLLPRKPPSSTWTQEADECLIKSLEMAQKVFPSSFLPAKFPDGGDVDKWECDASSFFHDATVMSLYGNVRLWSRAQEQRFCSNAANIWMYVALIGHIHFNLGRSSKMCETRSRLLQIHNEHQKLSSSANEPTYNSTPSS